MSDQPRPPTPLHVFPRILQERVRAYTALPADHPTKISTRTYGLALLLSLGPTLLPFITRVVILAKAGKGVDRVRLGKVVAGLGRLLRRELGPFGFAFAITTAVAGGSLLRNVFENPEIPLVLSLPTGGEDGGGLNSTFENVKSVLRRHWATLSGVQQTFLSNAIASAVAIILLQRSTVSGRSSGVPDFPLTLPIDDIPRRKGISPTLNLTLVLFVRALDSLVHGGLQDRLLQKLKGKGREVTPGSTGVEEATSRDSPYAKDWINKWTSNLDSLVFCVCSARIIWCFFYKPNTLPEAYVKWISRLAEIDPRVTLVLQSIRDGSLSYNRCYAASPDLAEFAEDLGYPASWGDLSVVPAYGTDATPIWRKLGVEGRNGIGGIPCELVHGGNGAGNSCRKNIGIRGQKAWLTAILIYLPVHLLPVIAKRPRDLISPERLIPTLLGVMRSATFLSTFVQLMWFGVCSTRTLVGARLFPRISHDYFDGPYGCVFIASLICGSSIWIENPRRRGEIALYVLPRAIRTVLSDSWLKGGQRRVRFIEGIIFIASLSTLLTSAIHKPESLRGLSKFAVNYVLKGQSSVAKKPL